VIRDMINLMERELAGARRKIGQFSEIRSFRLE
jgi:hypothetical protein